jgi:hypothetical protein
MSSIEAGEMSFRLGLKFLFPHMGGAAAYVVVKSHTIDDGDILLTSEAVSLTEFEAEVALLRKDLDEAVAKARKRFAVAKAAGPQPLFPDRKV